jgi:hypothetical protein
MAVLQKPPASEQRGVPLEHFVIENIYPIKCSGGAKRSAATPARLEQAGFARR